jgi:UDP-N-acetylglucosamine--N-acetylmuramyl-(pentapeptide) pyrophosphoryl-undecaprenol N-acetylglucosamine transferase
LLLVKKLPLPRKFTLSALSFPLALVRETLKVLGYIRRYRIDGVVGFGGYASPPAYLAGFLSRKPLVVHEANAIAGYANRLGAKLGAKVAVAFPNSDLPGTLTGMPLRTEIVTSAASYDKGQARIELGLDPMLPTLLVTGGSLGAKRINDTIFESLELLRAAGIQVLHIVGQAAGLEDVAEAGYRRMSYCARMDAAIAASNLAVSRSGASTVSEFSAAGLPAIYIPYPVGNGEQQQNAQTVTEAGGAQLVLDKDFNFDFVANRVIPILSHAGTLKAMSKASKSVAIVDGTLLLRDLLLKAVNTKTDD